jgi:hypothetical protein
MAGSEGASRSTSVTTFSRQVYVIHVDVQETYGKWGQFVEVATKSIFKKYFVYVTLQSDKERAVCYAVSKL